jgi:hypothetical protein
MPEPDDVEVGEARIVRNAALSKAEGPEQEHKLLKTECEKGSEKFAGNIPRFR